MRYVLICFSKIQKYALSSSIRAHHLPLNYYEDEAVKWTAGIECSAKSSRSEIKLSRGCNEKKIGVFGYSREVIAFDGLKTFVTKDGHQTFVIFEISNRCAPFYWKVFVNSGQSDDFFRSRFQTLLVKSAKTILSHLPLLPTMAVQAKLPLSNSVKMIRKLQVTMRKTNGGFYYFPPIFHMGKENI